MIITWLSGLDGSQVELVLQENWQIDAFDCAKECLQYL